MITQDLTSRPIILLELRFNLFRCEIVNPLAEVALKAVAKPTITMNQLKRTNMNKEQLRLRKQCFVLFSLRLVVKLAHQIQRLLNNRHQKSLCAKRGQLRWYQIKSNNKNQLGSAKEFYPLYSVSFNHLFSSLVVCFLMLSDFVLLSQLMFVYIIFLFIDLNNAKSIWWSSSGRPLDQLILTQCCRGAFPNLLFFIKYTKNFKQRLVS